MLETSALKIVKKWLNYYIEFHSCASISVGITDSIELEVYSLGNYDKDNNIKASSATNYSIGSLSKIYSVINILKLKQEGKLQLFDKVSKHLKYYPYDTKINDLLSHSSGLPRDGDFNFWLNEEFPNSEELIESLKKVEIAYPGKYKYSNLGYAILGLILDKFDLGIRQDKINNVIGYGKKLLGNQKVYNFIDSKSFSASLGLHKNIQELTEFTKSILIKDASMLDKNIWDEMFQVIMEVEDDDDVTYGFRKWKNEQIFECSGYSFGFASSMLIDFEEQMAFVVSTNSVEEKFAGYYTRSIRKILKYCTDSNIFFDSDLNGLYRSKDYDVFLYDCGEKLFIFNPADVTPFHSENFEEYKKIDENKFELLNKKDDPYQNETLSFNFNHSGKVSGFKQGGWGFGKI